MKLLTLILYSISNNTCSDFPILHEHKRTLKTNTVNELILVGNSILLSYNNVTIFTIKITYFLEGIVTKVKG